MPFANEAPLDVLAEISCDFVWELDGGDARKEHELRVGHFNPNGTFVYRIIGRGDCAEAAILDAKRKLEEMGDADH